MYNFNTKENSVAYNEALEYVHWLDATMNGVNQDIGQLPLHYCFNNEMYDCLVYYEMKDSKEIYYYTPHSYHFIGVSRNKEDTYTFLRRLIYDEFGWVEYVNDKDV